MYAGIFKEYAWCWSQVNKSEYEKEFMPRHLIEWEVIKFLKKNKFKYYEIGSLFNENNNYDVSKKELSIVKSLFALELRAQPPEKTKFFEKFSFLI